MNSLQCYAYDKKGVLAHCAPLDFALPIPTMAEVRKHERKWRTWRNAYIKTNPGSYPLKDNKRNGHIYVVITPQGNQQFNLAKL